MALKIVDISRHQGGPIDWERVARAVDGVIIRIGLRGYKYNRIVSDTRAQGYIKGAEAAGIPWGVYFFSQRKNAAEGKEEASWTVQRLKDLAARNLRPLYPVFIDTELSGSRGNVGRADHITKEARTAAVRAFCEEVQQAGYMAGIYAGVGWFKTQLNDSELLPFAHWVAHWIDGTGPAYAGRFGIWQYTNNGAVAGIPGRVDLNRGYINYPQIIREKGLNGWTPEDRPDIIKPFSGDPVGIMAGPMSAGDVKTITDLLRGLVIEYKTETDGAGTMILTGRVSQGDQVTIIKACKKLGLGVEPYETATEAPQDEPTDGKEDSWPAIEKPTEGPQEPTGSEVPTPGQNNTDPQTEEPERPNVGPLGRKIIIAVLRYIIKLFGGGSGDD